MNDWLDFIASIIDSLAWPGALAIVVYLLRNELRSMIPRIRRLRGANFEVEFGETLERLEEDADAADLPPAFPPAAPGPPDPDEELLMTSTEVSPRGAILDSWVLLEDELRGAARRVGVEAGPRSSAGWLVRKLAERQHIAPDVRALIEDLRALRNAAVHNRDFKISGDEAYEFGRLARRLTNALATIAADDSSRG